MQALKWQTCRMYGLPSGPATTPVTAGQAGPSEKSNLGLMRRHGWGVRCRLLPRFDWVSTGGPGIGLERAPAQPAVAPSAKQKPIDNSGQTGNAHYPLLSN